MCAGHMRIRFIVELVLWYLKIKPALHSHEMIYPPPTRIYCFHKKKSSRNRHSCCPVKYRVHIFFSNGILNTQSPLSKIQDHFSRTAVSHAINKPHAR